MKWLLMLLLIVSVWSDTLTVDVYHFPPCVIVENDKVSGFDIELFERVADDAGLTYKYNVLDDFSMLFKRLEEKKSDIAIAGITINNEREAYLDFSHTYLKSGLSILVRNEGSGMVDIIGAYFAKTWKALVVFLIFLFGCSLLWSLFECEKGFFSGLANGLYWTNTTITTVGYGDKTPGTAKGKILATIVMWVGIVVIFPYVVAQMSQTVTAAATSIRSQEDLKHKKVSVVDGTTSEKVVRDLGADVHDTKSGIGMAVGWLENKVVDAFVCDMPVVKDYAKKSKGKLIVAGEMFDEQDYGFALQQNSKLREPINIALLRTMKASSDTQQGKTIYDSIYKKWFKE